MDFWRSRQRKHQRPGARSMASRCEDWNEQQEKSKKMVVKKVTRASV